LLVTLNASGDVDQQVIDAGFEGIAVLTDRLV
jgi:hypothetical protein